MASASGQRSGIITWVNALRMTMANDPGRQTLQDQVQTNGLLFLDEYLENILAGPRHDPIIELVKTPGRKRDFPKKTRAATAAASKAKGAMSLEEDDYDKENMLLASNIVPINSFHKKLLDAKATEHQDDKPRFASANSVNFQLSAEPMKPNNRSTLRKVLRVEETKVVDVTMEDDDDNERTEMLVEKTITPANRPSPVETPVETATRDIVVATNIVPDSTSKDLSMIAEDDELIENNHSPMPTNFAPKSPLSVSPPNPPESIRISSENRVPLKPPPNLDMMAIMDIEDMTTTFTPSTSGSTQTFHSIDLGSPAVPPQDTLSKHPQDVKEKEMVDRPEEVEEVKKSTGDVQSESLPSNAATLDDYNSVAHVSPKFIPAKLGIPHFPTIGAPSPLRKSMRTPREPSISSSQHMPGQMPTVARSSWLVKAREAKALEENAKRTNISGPSNTTQNETRNKRKSDTIAVPIDEEDEEEVGRKRKLSKIRESSSIHDVLDQEVEQLPEAIDITDAVPGEGSEGMLNKLKKTVEGFSARAGKSMGKSLGGAAATALAEARAAAEARIAERNGTTKSDTSITTESLIDTTKKSSARAPSPVFKAAPVSRLPETHSEADRRFSVSDLVSKLRVDKPVPEPVFKPPPFETQIAGSVKSKLADASISTTPPDSPPHARSPIFSLPEKGSQQGTKASMFTRHPLSEPQSLTQTFESFSKLRPPAPLSNQSTYVSTQSSTFADSVFGHSSNSWMPETQDTQFSDLGASQYEQTKDLPMQDNDYMDADESWRDDKLDPAWMPAIGFVGKDDSMTWSSAPTQSGDTGTMNRSENENVFGNVAGASTPARQEIQDADGTASDMDDEEDDDFAHQVRLVPSAAQSTTSQDSQTMPESQSSNANTSSQSGFLGTAARLMTSVLGGSKSRKPEPVKSLQLAAAAAKKQQEAEEKKVTRLKEMEQRRQQILQKKADDEKLREEKKAKEDTERRKRERDDLTEKRALKLTMKTDDDAAKKRKVAEPEKKPDVAKASAPEVKKVVVATKSSKANLTMQPNASQPNLAKSLKQSSSILAVNNKPSKTTTAPGASQTSIQNNAKAKGKGKALDDELVDQPALAMQAQMQARVKVQLADLRKSEQPTVASESIVLPDINSEYSDSEDEDRVRTFDPPQWAQSPELRAQLQSMSTLNPDDIFGAIKPLKMEELFKTRTSRFRARTSSANWAGVDELTAHEEREYARRMGYKK